MEEELFLKLAQIYLFLIITAFVVSKAAAQPRCTMRDILEAQRAQFPAEQAQIPLPDGSTMRNPYATSEAEQESALLTVTSTHRQKVNSLFESLKVDFIQEITRGAAAEQWTSAQRMMIQRIQTLSVRLESCDRPLASNAMLEHRVTVCSSAMRLPQLSLVALLAHEIGHSIDLCNLGNGFFRKVGNPIFSTFFKEESFTSDSEFMRQLERVSASQVTHFMEQTFCSHADRRERLQSMVQQGVIERVDSGLPIAENPSYRTYRCLEDKARYSPVGDGSIQTCRVGDASEAGAQIWAARLVSRYVERNPPTSELDRLGLFAGSMPYLNKGVAGKERDMNEIYLAEPAIQRMFGCQPTETQVCMRHFSPGGATAPAAGSTQGQSGIQ